VKTLLKYWIYRQTQTNKFVKWVLRTFVGWTVGVHASDGTTLNILLTVDVEPGYVEPSGKRVWEYMDPEASVGYLAGTQHFLDLFKKHEVPATFFVSNQCGGINNSKELNNHEIGFHLHPGQEACNYDLGEQIKMLKDGKKFIKKQFGRTPISFRWGAWGANGNTFKALEKTGFEIDSSICPGCSSDRVCGSYNWSKWWRNLAPEMVGNVLEVPTSTFVLLFKCLRADPIYSDLLRSVLEQYINEHHAYLVISTHSSEATDADGNKTSVVDVMDDFIRYAQQFNVKFIRMEDVKCLESY